MVIICSDGSREYSQNNILGYRECSRELTKTRENYTNEYVVIEFGHKSQLFQ